MKMKIIELMEKMNETGDYITENLNEEKEIKDKYFNIMQEIFEIIRIKKLIK